MNAITYSELRKNLKQYMDEAFHDRDPIIITRKNSENVVLLSIDDYNALTETQYLTSSEKNAKRLLSSLKKARSGRAFRKDLVSS